MNFELLPEDYLAQPPSQAALGIGIVGCGSIVRQAHLPAYRAWKLPVVACCDLNSQVAGEVAHDFSIPFHTSRLDELLDREEVQIVDLAVHAAIRPQCILSSLMC